MANNVTNKLRFDKCSKERCREILEAIQIDRIGLGSIDFNKIIPEPYFPSDQDCINWRIKNWDTKWEAYGYRDGIQYDEEKNQIRFLTANRSARKLMPIECWRLQGFTDEQFHKAQSAGLSDARLYKMAGNAVSVPVITALGEIIKRVHENSQKEADNG